MSVFHSILLVFYPVSAKAHSMLSRKRTIFQTGIFPKPKRDL
ncbi:hypothetical protein CLOM621_07681 [Clostridium sp. M62/1]|nr:hypothetical protein CLOM621_07681 [Clostridium sp. M62/1]